MQNGFTLLELLVALAVFAFVSMMAYGGLRAVLDAREHTDRVSRDLAELQMALTLLGRDLEHVVPRPVRDVYGDIQAPLTFNPYGDRPRLELVRTSPHSGLQRVAWEISDERLYRLYWAALDGADPEQPAGRLPVMGPVEEVTDSGQTVEVPDSGQPVTEWTLRFHFRESDGTLVSSETWPLEINPGSPETLPLAVELTLETEGSGPVTRWFAVQ